MFRCDVTGKTTSPRVPLTRIVVETRPKVYINWKFNPDTLETDKIVSHGYETVKEIWASPEGVQILEEAARKRADLAEIITRS